MTAMAKVSCFMFVFMTFGFVQASVENKFEEMVHSLAEKAEEEMLVFKSGADSVVEKAKSEFESVAMKLENSVHEKMNLAYEEGNRRQCNPDVFLKIKTVHESAKDRFLNCINFTQSLVDLETYVYHVYHEAAFVEDLVCQGIKNVTACTGGFISKFGCYTNVMGDLISDIKSQSSQLRQIFGDLVELGERIASKFMKCFTNVEYTSELEMANLLNTQCHKNLFS